ncbi:hypothetical protein [Kutzneria buriramensis]|uniref:hypothetical protein n=1 Tax=Kutzneria buriramensis TaxID=1045776 RepID=UPI001FE5A13A|nr:hypothetical protein [Kutzneria buriramensis]
MIVGLVVGLTFLFGFGNVLDLAMRLGVPIWIAPLVAPALDLSVLGLLLGLRHLVLIGATAEQLRPARRLLVFASLATLALNVAGPLSTGTYGRAAFDAVGPLLLIGWAEVGPTFLQALVSSTADSLTSPTSDDCPSRQEALTEDVLLERARREDARHWAEHQRPISAETLRKQLNVGAARSRLLVSLVRSGRPQTPSATNGGDDADLSVLGSGLESGSGV